MKSLEPLEYVEPEEVKPADIEVVDEESIATKENKEDEDEGKDGDNSQATLF